MFYGDFVMEYQKLHGLSELNMNILQFDNVTLTSSWKAANVTSSFTRIYMVTQGVGWLKYGENVMRMTAGNVYIVPAGLTFSYSCEDGFSKMYFHLSVRQSCGYDIFHGLDQCIEIHDPEGIELTKSNFNCSTIVQMLQIKVYLYNLVCQCMKFKEDTEIKKYSCYITEAMEYIGKNLSANLKVKEIADALFTSPQKLRKCFYEETGILIGKYIDDLIMFTAECELQNNSLSIKDISELLGFCDQFYFSRCFTKKYGISPLKYRKTQIYYK